MSRIWNRIRGRFGIRRLRTRLALGYMAACFVPLAMMTAVIYAYAAGQLHQSAMEFAEIYTSQLTESLDAQYDEYDRITKSILYDQALLEALTGSARDTVSGKAELKYQIRRLLMKVKTLQPRLNNVMFLTAEGEVITYNDHNLVAAEEGVRESEWAGRILGSEETLMFSEAHPQDYLIGNTDTRVVTVSRKIYDYNSRYLGVLLMDQKPEDLIVLGSAFEGRGNRYRIRINISNAGGLGVYDSAAGEAADGLPEPESTDRDNIVYTRESRKTRMEIQVLIPRGRLLMRVSLVRGAVAAGFLGSVLLMLATALLISRSINRPIRVIRTRMAEAEQGNYQEIRYRSSTEELMELIGSYNHMILRIRRLIQDVYMAQIKQKNAEYAALQTQINPHMLYNTLEAIRMNALMSGADGTAEEIKTLSRLFRSVLKRDRQAHTLADELEYARTYLQIQNIRKQDMFLLETEVPEELLGVAVIPVILQPLIENSIRHGFRGYRQPLHILIRGERSGAGGILLSVTDDGKGMTEEEVLRRNAKLLTPADAQGLPEGEEEPPADDGHGIGLENIRDRLRLYYGPEAYVKFSLDPEGRMRVGMLIPRKETR